jgi:hypothetical protein
MEIETKIKIIGFLDVSLIFFIIFRPIIAWSSNLIKFLIKSVVDFEIESIECVLVFLRYQLIE